ncbi:PAS domain S-box protein [Pseudodesulfovibrio sp. F-1]|uniref:histidine kinase n=1 Tax=Pseudodesulfovibrio alkaliphilus TaxID=2661613 RepID=A0A7K1KR37_9BACT|nr:PAS domain S-box protein [Pseudodesulfovibrio alkaliphilus]MUM78565.1 PAS domain S-box protein [Pseudodesulfovibrio alkaliphilus]
MPRRIACLIPLLVGLALAAALAAIVHADGLRHAQQTRLEVFHRLSMVQGGFEGALNARLLLARTLRVVISLDPDLNQQAFANLVKGLLADMGGVRFVKLVRDDRITHAFPEATARPGQRLSDVSPPEVGQAALRAARTGQIQVLAPTRMPEGDESVVALMPAVLPDGGHWGMVVMWIEARPLLREAGIMDASLRLDIAFREQTADGWRLMHGAASVFAADPVVMNTPVPQGVWQAGAVPLGGWRPSPNRVPLIFGGGALVLVVTTALLAIMRLLSVRLREREQYRYLVQNARSIILRIDQAGDIVFCNEHTERLLGYEPGELMGMPLVGTLIPERGPDGESAKRRLNKLLRDPAEPVLAETAVIRRSGELVWVSWAYSPVRSPDGTLVELLCVGTEITDRRKAEEALRKSERQYRLLADNVTDVIWGTDADLRVTFVSKSDLGLRGFARADVLGRPLCEFLTGVSRGRLQEAVATLKGMVAMGPEQLPAVTQDLEFLCADGRSIWLETRLGLLLNESGDSVGMLGVGRDITDRKLAEALRDDVERMARHDLKTPLGAVVGLPGEILRLGGLSEAQSAMLLTIEQAGEAMLTLINRSLDLFKMERGTYVLNRSPVDLLQTLERIKAECRFILREKGVSVGIEVEGGMPDEAVVIPAEEDLLHSMLANLLLNAFQASPEGGSVTISLALGDPLTLTIRNQGEVPPGIREAFFQKYARAEASPGSGLGTYSARLMALTHGGDISLDAATPGETRVIVTLPRR